MGKKKKFEWGPKSNFSLAQIKLGREYPLKKKKKKLQGSPGHNVGPSKCVESQYGTMFMKWAKGKYWSDINVIE